MNETNNKDVKYAGFWRRLAASIVDSTIVGILFLLLNVLLGVIIASIGMIAYYVGFWVGLGQTPGKAAIGMRIVKTDGTRIGFGTAILRFFGYIVSSLILYIGFIVIAFHGQKRGLHDLIAGTMVISETGPLQQALAPAEFEASLARMDEVQTECHGL